MKAVEILCYSCVTNCIQDTLSLRAALGIPAFIGRVRRASKGILHTSTRR